MRHSIIKLTQLLEKKFSDRVLCTQYAQWILQAITQKSDVELALADELILSQQQEQQLTAWLEQLLEYDKPLQYILGSVPFGDVDIVVRPPVLIPRPETEEWCMKLVYTLQFLHNKNLTIIDLCSGSGCIAVALAKALPFAHIIAVDISDQAVALASENAVRNDVALTVIQSDLFLTIPTTIKADLIVANPPYISPTEYHDLDPSVSQWEDRRALVADDDGLSIIKAIIQQAPRWIKANQELALHGIPQLMIEVGSQQSGQVIAQMAAADYTAITVHKDLEGKDRVVSGRVSHGAISDQS